MKKICFCCLLIFIIMNFCGCDTENPDSTVGLYNNPSANHTISIPTESAQHTEAIPILPLNDSQMADPVTMVIDLPPISGRDGLAISGRKEKNMDWGLNYSLYPFLTNLYPNASPFNTFRILCPSYYEWKLETFQASLFFRSICQTEVHEWIPELVPQMNAETQPNALPYYVYASWRGMDWKTLAELELALRDAPEDETVIMARDKFRDQFLDDFRALQPADLPTLPYLYEVSLLFPADADGGEVIDELLAPIDLYAECRRGVFGLSGITPMISLHAEDPRSLEAKGILLAAPGYEVRVIPLNDGDCSCMAMEFTADEDIILHCFKLSKSKVIIREIILVRTRDDETVEETWDGKSDITIQPGETVKIVLTLHDPDAENQAAVYWPDGAIHSYDPLTARPEDYVEWSNATLGEYFKDQFCTLEYTTGTELHLVTTELVLRQNASPWELIFLLSCDEHHEFSKHLYSYYLDYVNPLFNPAWRGAFLGNEEDTP